MYLDFFGLTTLPFRARTDSHSIPIDATADVAATLDGALQGRQPLVVLYGEAGVGKSLVVESVLRRAAPTPVLRIHQPPRDALELRHALAYQLQLYGTNGTPGMEPEHSVTPEAQNEITANPTVEQLIEAMAAKPLLVVDHAHTLPNELLKWLLDLGHRHLMQLWLIGRCDPAEPTCWIQATMLETASPIFLAPFSEASTSLYIRGRLRNAATRERTAELFTEGACAAVFGQSRGVARSINVLCDLALAQAFSRNLPRVSETEVVAATREGAWADCLSRQSHAPAVVAENFVATTVLPSTRHEVAPTNEHDGDSSVAAPPARPVGHEGGRGRTKSSARIQLVHDGSTMLDLRLPTGRLRIGRMPDNDLAIDSEYISRRHCELVVIRDAARTRTMLVDLGSRNGTLVNGRRVRQRELRDGDEIAIGSHMLRYFATAAPT